MATVAAAICFAPPCLSIFAQVRTVVPVVYTSSINKMRSGSAPQFGFNAIAPFKLVARAVLESVLCGGVSFVLHKMSSAGVWHSPESAFAMQSVWL